MPDRHQAPLNPSIVSPNPRIVVAMDFDGVDACLNLANQLDPSKCRLKIGKELFTVAGPTIVEALQKLGFDVFLDLKFHDIPATVAKAVSAAASLGVWMVNVHVSGGARMLEAAREAIVKYERRPLLIGVTVLTSMGQEELAQLGINAPLDEHVIKLARMAQNTGLDGVVCSAQETQKIRASCGADFVLVTPGIRPVGFDANDQHRIVTPDQALSNGSHYLVIGRPITQSSNPVATCEQILQSISH